MSDADATVGDRSGPQPHPGPDPATNARETAELDRVWQDPTGWRGALAVNHKQLAKRYLFTAFAFFAAAGVMALMMRLQLAVPENDLIGHELYNQLFTMHGSTMMFFFAVPVVEAVAMYLLPLMLGSRDLVFPRLSAFGYWCYLFGGLLLLSSFVVGMAPDMGWYAYVPLAGKEFSPGLNPDFWLLGVTFAEISAVSAALELVVTILKCRAPGMSINRMPLLAWYMLVVALMILFGFPALILGSILLEVERAFGWPFFDPAEGGSALLWQHYFWIFGHPEVYIIFLPAAGFVSMIVPTFAKRPLVGHEWVVLAVIGTGFVSMGLWVHHMFTTGLPFVSLGFFSSASMTVSVLSGIQVFAWIATLWNSRPVLATPMLFTGGFIITFVMGGLTGVMLGIVPFNWQAHDTHFVVAHLHYVLIGGMVFPLFAALYYWWPKLTGWMLGEGLGRWNFWVMFAGIHLAFFPMHIAGLLGMPRRVYTYRADMGWDLPNLLSTLGALLFASGVLLFAVNVLVSRRRAIPAGPDPWQAGTLEWAIDSPAPNYNFRSVPLITSAYPLWDQPQLQQDIRNGRGFLGPPRGNLRLTTGSTPTHGEMDQIVVLPRPTPGPLIAALGLLFFFVAVLLKHYAVSLAGVGLAALVFMYWGWHEPERRPVAEAEEEGIHLHSEGPRSVGWWGLGLTLLFDAMLFTALVFGFLLLWSQSDAWPSGNLASPDWSVGALALALLAASMLPLAFVWRATRQRRHRALAGGMLACALLGIAGGALSWEALERAQLDPRQQAFTAMTAALFVFQTLHIAIGVAMLLFAAVRALVAGFAPGARRLTRIVAGFWGYALAVTLVTALLLRFLPDWNHP